MFGLGGVLVEVFKDVSFRLLPIDYNEAEEMVKSINAYKILKGVRGSKAIDIEYIKENLLKLSRLITDFPEIEEVDFNPFVVSTDRNKFKILDARIKIKK